MCPVSLQHSSENISLVLWDCEIHYRRRDQTKDPEETELTDTQSSPRCLSTSVSLTVNSRSKQISH